MKKSKTDFLIITALPVERDAILNLFGFTQFQSNSLIYEYAEVGTRNNIKIALTMLSKMGNVESGIHVTKAIRELNPKYVFMVGIAGGIKGKVNLGDVLVGTDIFYYEQAKSHDEGIQFRPQAIQVDSLLQSCAENILTDSWIKELIEIFPTFYTGEAPLPKVHFGPLASGEKVVTDQDLIAKLLDFQPKLLGVEMESYGVARAATADPSRPRFIAIRGVSDFANKDKNDGYHVYAATAAALFARALINAETLTVGYPKNESLTLLLVKHMSMEFVPSNAIEEPASLLTLSPNRVEFVIDQTDLFEKEKITDPLSAVGRQQEKIEELRLLTHGFNSFEVVYYGIVHIPLAFLFGFQFRPRTQIHFVEHDRKDDQWKVLSPEREFPPLIVTDLPIEGSEANGDVIVNFSISYPVLKEDVLPLVPSPMAIVDVALVSPELDIVKSANQLNAYAMTFRKVLDEIHKVFPNTSTVHVFYAGPVSLAFRCGQIISPTIHPNIRVYNYLNHDNPKYNWSVCVNTPIDSPDFPA